MASGVYQKGKDEIAKQNLDAQGSANVVLIPVSSSYTFDETQDFVDEATAADVASHELNADGYTAGFGSSDRLTPANRTWDRDDANSRIEFDFADATFSGLGGGTSSNNDTMGGVVLAEERTSDADSVLIAYDELNDNRATNGSDITYSPDNEGMFQLD